MSTTITSRWAKGRALLAGGLVLGLGAAATLAAWTDDEWVFGGSGLGNGSEPNTPGTGIYSMEQNTWSGVAGAEAWSGQKKRNGGALTFTANPEKLVPGKTVYSPMQLRSVKGSEALTVSLAQGIQSELNRGTQNSTDLYAALTYSAFAGVTKDKCAAGIVTDALELVPAGSALGTASTKTFALRAGTATDPGEAENLCFALTLPADASDKLQGLNTVPVWKFTSSVGSAS